MNKFDIYYFIIIFYNYPFKSFKKNKKYIFKDFKKDKKKSILDF